MNSLNLNSLVIMDLREQEMANTIGADDDSSVCLSGFCGIEENSYKQSTEIVPEKGTAISSSR